ncbi:uncharacterized protein BDZ99DRAFT_516909 [Mytilinidion resinicola]|uniref:Uncharacterized protein n=1 Tax=Mytilinidion resinicola TaxID=574789 RepID=A0A6A6Z0S4_9PEZI|nr:uncharacterized protein BDZ99DRAFT_516909 [Mytilinidion resinicola]KAF2814303.1 hypothetical protein BDZ99DRAFT_516909 [Mytilinidion resinicola]
MAILFMLYAMSPDDITALVQSMSIKDSKPPPPKPASDPPKRYNAVPPPATIQPKPRKSRYTPRPKTKHPNGSAAHAPPNPQQPPNPTSSPQDAQHSNEPASSPNPPRSQPRHRNPPPNPKPPPPSARLRAPKRFVPASPDPPAPPPSPERVYTVLFEPYGVVAGVFSSLVTATTAVRALGGGGGQQGGKGGAEGLRVFGVRGGRLEIVPQKLRDVRKEGEGGEGEEGGGGERTGPGEEAVRTASRATKQSGSEGVVFLAVDRSLVIGAFKGGKDAWEACVEHREQVSWCATAPLREKSEWVDARGLPRARGRIEGGGWHEWGVEVYELDEIVGLREEREREREMEMKERLERGLEGRLRDVERRLRGMGIPD